jgi:hypothetical protein
VIPGLPQYCGIHFTIITATTFRNTPERSRISSTQSGYQPQLTSFMAA